MRSPYASYGTCSGAHAYFNADDAVYQNRGGGLHESRHAIAQLHAPTALVQKPTQTSFRFARTQDFQVQLEHVAALLD